MMWNANVFAKTRRVRQLLSLVQLWLSKSFAVCTCYGDSRMGTDNIQVQNSGLALILFSCEVKICTVPRSRRLERFRLKMGADGRSLGRWETRPDLTPDVRAHEALHREKLRNRKISQPKLTGGKISSIITLDCLNVRTEKSVGS